jgi:steroid 5-alpha reductase family enzyme
MEDEINKMTYLIFIWAYFSMIFIIASFKKRNDMLDIAWGLGFVLIAWASFFRGNHALIAALANGLVTFWGLRLFSHILKRYHSKGEDPRYAAFRSSWKSAFLIRAYVQLFLSQALFMGLIALPILLLNHTSFIHFNGFVGLGFLISIFGLCYEGIADAQLKSFLASPQNRGRVMKQGLWRYSRHPNYFGEIVFWWGLALSAFSAGAGIWVWISPITITLLIIFVSGIPLLEKRYQGRPEFEAYKKETSMIVPLFKKVNRS